MKLDKADTDASFSNFVTGRGDMNESRFCKTECVNLPEMFTDTTDF